jgi:glycosyltransferase involved in cell wall biosynthesis
MKVLFIVRSGNHPATRHRVVQYLDYLKKADINSEVVYFPQTIFGWWRLLNRASNFDVVFFQKKRVHPFWLKRFKARGHKLIYDFDDAVMFNSSRHPTPASPLRMRQFISMVKRCDGIIAGNSYLKSLAEPYNQKIWIIPTTVDTSKYPVKSYSSGAPNIILGWIGTSSSLVFLKSLEGVLGKLSQAYKDIKLKIVCSEFFNNPDIEIIKKQWVEKDEAQDVLSFDIGLAPLPDDPWSQGKCATKLLQYLASSVPSVASAVGIHKEIIRDGVNGFLASNDDDWFNKIALLIEDNALRRNLGLATREIVEKYYSVKANAPKLIGILKRIVCE